MYATHDELAARISDTYLPLPADTLKLRTFASELLDDHTLLRAQYGWDFDATRDPKPYRIALAQAVAAQIEFWLEVGEEHDVAGLQGSLVAGRVQVHPVAPVLAPRAKRILRTAGLYWAGAAAG